MKIQKANKRTLLPIIIIVAVLIAGVAGAYFYSLKNNQDKADSKIDDTSDINYDPPTQQEVEANQDAKKRDSEDTSKQPNSSATDKRSVNVGVAYADINDKKLEIRAFTNSVIEGNAICTATITRNSEKITKSSKAFIDSSSSQCEPIYIPVSDLSSGTWKISVNFNSPDANGVSETLEVKVP